MRASDTRQPVRLGAVVALARIQAPQLGSFLNDMDAQVVTEAARGLYGNSDKESMRYLAALGSKPARYKQYPAICCRSIIPAWWSA